MISSLNIQKTLLLIICLINIVCIRTQVCSNNENDGTCKSPGADTQEQPEPVSRDVELKQTVDALMQWVGSNGGYVNPKLELRAFLVEMEDMENDEDNQDDDDDESSQEYGDDGRYVFGLFVKHDQDIKEGEELLRLPDRVMLYGDVQASTDVDNICLLSDELSHERRLHADGQSLFGPYIDFLEKFVVGNVRLPATWTQNGRYLIANITQVPYFTTFQHYYNCYLHGDSEGEVMRILNESGFEGFGDPKVWDENIEIALSRSRHDEILVPVYDMINHSNDQSKINIVAKKLNNPNDKSFSVFASRGIAPSEELRHSFGLGSPRENHWLGYIDYGMGTLELLREHGIIETYPQRWFFSEHRMDFRIHEVETENESNEGDEGTQLLRVEWLSETMPDDDAIYTLRVNYDGLVDIRDQMIEAWNSPDKVNNMLYGLTPHEISVSFELLLNYIAALETAFKTADVINTGSEYLVTEEKVTLQNVDYLYFQLYQCSTMITKVMKNEYIKIDDLQSAYQQIDYYKDPATDDRCLYLDNVYQQCISYWPHYHELVVHKSAKYLKEDLKRVLWVGGGDSGVLNEFLKFPTLELAVGLELDQEVTRSAFKHFASQPHYDDPRVQWWYGDASKSLLMLPKDYFGSFDLVIVDLSDTVFSLSVSAELDVIEAISLLLRPGGIFEMNELFLRKVSNVFEYSVHYQFSDVPKILDQSAIFASNDVDFMFQELTEHELVEDAALLVEKDSMLTKHQFDRIHDYRRNPNPAFKKLCKKLQAAEQELEAATEQSEAPGIMMIVEAENLTAVLSSPSVVQNSIITAIEKVGLTVISKKSSSLESPWFVIIMNEGYVIVRLWSEQKYCALDIHLWSSFDSHEKLKKAIVVDALGGDLLNKSTSSFRIVAGGMFGMPNWKEQSRTHGPQLDGKGCPQEEDSPLDQPSSLDVYELALETSLDVVTPRRDELTVAVWCNLPLESCASLGILEDHDNVNQMIPLYPCTVDDVILKDDETSANREFFLDECSMHRVQQTFEEELNPDEWIDMLVIDPSCTEDFSDSLRYLRNGTHVNMDNIAVVGTVDSKGDVWKRKIVDYFRYGVIQVDPVHRTHVLFNSTGKESSLELVLSVSGDERFMEHLVSAVEKARVVDGDDDPTADVTVEIRNIFGGYWREEKIEDCEDKEEFVPSQVTKAEDYDRTDARSQWSSQRPLGIQSVARFVNQEIQQDGSSMPVPLDDPKKLMNVVRNAFAEKGFIFTSHENMNGGDGVICTGIWEHGTAVISWDGRSQVDVNLWMIGKTGSKTGSGGDAASCDADDPKAGTSSFDDKPESRAISDHKLLEEIKLLELVITANTATTLEVALRDIQPRGHGRIVNFQKDIEGADTFFNQHNQLDEIDDMW